MESSRAGARSRGALSALPIDFIKGSLSVSIFGIMVDVGIRFVDPLRQNLDQLLSEANAQRRRERGWSSWLLCQWSSEVKDQVIRLCHTIFVFGILLFSALLSSSPWVISWIQMLTMGLVYAISDPAAVRSIHGNTHTWQYHFSRSPEDILMLTVARFACVMLSYKFVPGRNALVYRRPYLMTTLLAGTIEVTFAAVKLGAVTDVEWKSKSKERAVIAICCLSIFFSCLHCAAAQGALAWARRRSAINLMMTREHGLDPPWDYDAGVADDIEAPEERLEHNEPKRYRNGFVVDIGSTENILDESRCVRIHYQLVYPAHQGDRHKKRNMASTVDGCYYETCIMLHHGFGGGIHSWRHIIERLADETGLPVVAYDRPGFGLTSRPAPEDPGNHRYYSMQYSALISIHLALFLGFNQWIPVGIGDGAMVVLLAVAYANSWSKPNGHADDSIDEFNLASRNANAQEDRDDRENDFITIEKVVRFDDSASLLKQRSEDIYEELLSCDDDNFGRENMATTPSSVVYDGSIRVLRDEGIARLDRADTESPSHSNLRTLQCPVSVHKPQLPTSAGMIMIHPDLSGFSGPPYLVALLNHGYVENENSSLFPGQFALEVGDVGHASAWASGSPPQDVISLYQRKLRRPAWQKCLLEVCKQASSPLARSQSAALLEEATQRLMPALIIEGSRDEAGKRRSGELAIELDRGVMLAYVPDTARVSMEESPGALTDIMVAFIRQRIQTQQSAGTPGI